VDPQMLSFGGVEIGRPVRTQLQVENAGGEAVSARLHVPAPFSLEADTLALAPASRHAVFVTLAPTAAGPVQGVLQIESAAGRVDVPLQAEARAAGSAVDAPAPSMPRSTGVELVQKTGAATEQPAFTESRLRYVPSKVSGVTPNTATIEWRANEPGATGYRAELQTLSLAETRELQVSWTQHPHFTTTPGDRRMIGRLERLQPASPYTVRVVPLYANGEPGEPLFEVALRTPAKPVTALRKNAPWLGIATLLIASGAAWWHFRRRQSGSL
jgi:hypothetical protein